MSKRKYVKKVVVQEITPVSYAEFDNRLLALTKIPPLNKKPVIIPPKGEEK